MKISIFLSFLFLFLPQSPSFAQEEVASLRNQDIALARFGDVDRQDLLLSVSNIEEEINRRIIGQEAASQALSSKLLQYLDSREGRVAGMPPIAQHFIGFPGIGKSALAEILEKHVEVIRVDAQRHQDAESVSKLFQDISHDRKKPKVLLIEEIDKVREILSDGKEVTQPFIAVLNGLLNDGRVLKGEESIDFSQMMVITTMNLPSDVMEDFSEKALGKSKSFYEFTIEDFAKIHGWISGNQSSVTGALSKMFRSNTVGRLAPNIMVMKHFSEQEYRQITQEVVEATLTRMTEMPPVDERGLRVTYSDRLIDFIFRHGVNPPLGAREIVVRANNTVEQLLNYSMRARVRGQISLDRPRKVHLDFDDDLEHALVTITPQKQTRAGILVDDSPHTLKVSYSGETASFVRPPEVTFNPPPSTNRVRPLTISEMLSNRFPRAGRQRVKVAREIGKKVYGQEIFAQYIEEEMNKYLSAEVDRLREPLVSMLAGFPGIGKSTIVEALAEALELPIIRVNLQNYASTEAVTAQELIHFLEREVMYESDRRSDGKYIVLFEEVDKVAEIDRSGRPIERPVLSVIKDLIDRGRVENADGSFVDVRGGYIFSTMNFDGKLFDFEADPRLTTIDDTIKAWEKIRQSPAQLKSILENMFRPDTISRFLPKLHVLRPLEEEHYRKVILGQIDRVIRERFFSRRGGDRGQVELALHPSYVDYLLRESVIPSEGARYSAEVASSLMSKHLEDSLIHVPGELRRATPLVIELSYLSDKTMVRATAREGQEGVPVEILQKAISLSFPPPQIREAPIPERRLLVGIHEFGHALMAARLGLHIETISVISPKAGIGGFVKYSSLDGAKENASFLVAQIYSALASRALERIVLSSEPRDPRSVLSITDGATSDMAKATEILHDVLFELGLHPDGMTGNTDGLWPGKGSSFSGLPHKTLQEIGFLLREMEDFIVDDLLHAHDIDWYREKILVLTREGVMGGGEFLKLIDYPVPTEHSTFLGRFSRLHKVFEGDVKEALDEITPRQQMLSYLEKFEELLKASPLTRPKGRSCISSLNRIVKAHPQ